MLPVPGLVGSITLRAPDLAGQPHPGIELERAACLKCLGAELTEWNDVPMPCTLVALPAGPDHAASLVWLAA